MAKEKNNNQNNLGQIRRRILEEEMQQSYLDYAMSVIVSRALPDVRDGLKPVHRRILYAMYREGLRHSARYSKCAGVVGEVLKRYHPHGDMAVYDSLVRMAQPWSMRYPLIDGQGNFGSIDGDSAAAYRYTEARLAPVADEVLADIEKETVDLVPNFDATTQEPTVLPAKVPQLLMNGTVGIAVGMATNIPPHNLGELIAACVQLLDKPSSSLDELMEHIPGPDFPTGGTIYNPEEIRTAYGSGKGSIVMRARAEIVEEKGKFQIIVTELPFQVNKAALLEKIAELVKNKKITGIADLRDESDREGIRIVVDLKKEAYPRKVLNQLFKMTPMQSVFHVNLLALVDGIQPKVLDLKSALQHFIDYRREVVTRRTGYELKRAEERLHVLEGLLIALKNLDQVIAAIKKSASREEAQKNLIKKFRLTEIQANAILEMRLAALAALERQKVVDEHKEKKDSIMGLKGILASPKKIDGVIRKEFLAVKERYEDKRRTEISKQTLGKFSEKDLIPNEEVVVTLTGGGYIKRQPLAAYRLQKRGGKGVLGMTIKEEDIIESIKVARNHDDILFFTNRGRVFRQKVYEVPLASRIAKGTAIVNLVQLAPEEKVTGTIMIPDSKGGEGQFFAMITQRGIIKKTPLKAYQNIRASGLIAIKLDAGDQLSWIRLVEKGDEVVIITQAGQAIRFKEGDARSIGRSARGVRAIKLRPGDQVVGADVAGKGEKVGLLVVTEKGLGKKTPLSFYNLQKRGGLGVKTLKVTPRTGKLVGACLIGKEARGDVLMTSKQSQVIRLPLKSVPTLSRVTQGVTLMRLKGGDSVASFTLLFREEEIEEPKPVERREEKVQPKVEPPKEKKEKITKPPPRAEVKPSPKRAVPKLRKKKKLDRISRKEKPKPAKKVPLVSQLRSPRLRSGQAGQVKPRRAKLIKVKKLKPRIAKAKAKTKGRIMKGGFRLRRLK